MDLKTITSGQKKRRPIADRFWSKVNRAGPNDCWIWTGALTSKGYGRLTAGRKNNLKAHRVAYSLTYGPFSDTENVLHECDNPPCCNPKHLFLGSKKDNTRDMMSKGRMSPPPHPYGEQHHATKFDASTALKIIDDKRTLRVIAADYGISWMTVFRLKHKKTWKKLKAP